MTPGDWWPFHGGGSGWHQSAGRIRPGTLAYPDPDGKWRWGSRPWDVQVGKGRLVHLDSLFGCLWELSIREVNISQMWVHQMLGRRDYLPRLHCEDPAAQRSRILRCLLLKSLLYGCAQTAKTNKMIRIGPAAGTIWARRLWAGNARKGVEEVTETCGEKQSCRDKHKMSLSYLLMCTTTKTKAQNT